MHFPCDSLKYLHLLLQEKYCLYLIDIDTKQGRSGTSNVFNIKIIDLATAKTNPILWHMQ